MFETILTNVIHTWLLLIKPNLHCITLIEAKSNKQVHEFISNASIRNKIVW